MPRKAVKSVKVEPGEMLLAPEVDEPRGFAVENQTASSLLVSFRYDEATHLQSVVIEEPRPVQRPETGSKVVNEQLM